MVPMSTNDASGESRRKKRVISPMEITPTTGQKRSSKRKNTLRDAMSRLRSAKAHTAMTSARQLNEDLLQVGLAHLDIPHHDPLPVQLEQDLGETLLRRIDGGLDPSARLDDAQDAFGVGHEGGGGGGIELERDHVTEAQRGLVEKEQLGVVQECLREGEALLEPGGELVVRHTPMRGELAHLDEGIHAAAQGGPGQTVEPPVEPEHLHHAQAPQKRR